MISAMGRASLVVGVVLWSAACGGGASMGSCLTNAQICQFKKGTSTRADVEMKLGKAQQYLGTEAVIYVCQEASGNMIVHNDLVSFSFGSDGLLEDVTVIRQGSGATAPPDCIR
jgi:hypothetical protein